MSTELMHEPDVVEGELIEVEQIDNSSALMALNKSEIDQQIATAKRWPRSIKNFKRQALELATLDAETAESMFYVLPRAGKTIEGPSARLAEVVGSSWGNLRYGARIIGTDDKFITAQGACFDLEKNTAITFEVKRRITDKYGKRYSDDMITVTANAAMSIALRNAIFKVVPFALVKPIYEQARLTAIGKAESHDKLRRRWVGWFQKAGVNPDDVFELLGVKGVEDITTDHIITLTGLHTAIKDGETTIEEIFAEYRSGSAGNKKVTKSDLNETLAEKPTATESTTSPAEQKPDAPSSGASWDFGIYQKQIGKAKTPGALADVEKQIGDSVAGEKITAAEASELAGMLAARREELGKK